MLHFKNSVINVVGTYYTGIYKKPELINKIEIGKKVILLREPDNPHDTNAASVYLSGEEPCYGYIPRKIATRLAPILDRGSQYECFVKEKRGDRRPQIIISLTTYPVSRPNQPYVERSQNGFIQAHQLPRTAPATPTGKLFRRIVNFKAHCKNQIGVSGIYIIWNRHNKSYIGQSKNVGERWQVHRRNLLSRHHGNKELQHDWVQMGASEFRFDLLEKVEPDRLDEREKFHIIRLKSYFRGYNQTPDGQGDPNRKLVKVCEKVEPAIKTDSIIKSEDKAATAHASIIGKDLKFAQVPVTEPILTAPQFDDKFSKKIDASIDSTVKHYGWTVAVIIFIIPSIFLMYFSQKAKFSPPLQKPHTQITANATPEKVSVETEKKLLFILHEVQEGETLFKIANKYHTSIEQITKDNDIENKDLIYQGESLKVPWPNQEF
jgi:group I intron endonuclease